MIKALGSAIYYGILLVSAAAVAPFAAASPLSFVPEISAVSSRSASSLAFAETGSYLHRFESGKFYAGKGPYSRMKQTGKFLAQKHVDPPKSSEFFPASSDRAAFMNEHRLTLIFLP